jgi:hypothetical protein
VNLAIIFAPGACPGPSIPLSLYNRSNRERSIYPREGYTGHSRSGRAGPGIAASAHRPRIAPAAVSGVSHLCDPQGNYTGPFLTWLRARCAVAGTRRDAAFQQALRFGLSGDDAIAAKVALQIWFRRTRELPREP